MTQYISPHTVSAIFLLTILIGAGGTAFTLARANTALPAEPTSLEPKPAEVVRVLDERAFNTDTLPERGPYAPTQHDPVGDQSLNAKIARMIVVALQLRPDPLITSTSGRYRSGGDYTEADLERVLDIARRNNENTRSDINRSITDVANGGTLRNVTIENGILDGLSVTGSTNFMSNVGIGTNDPTWNLHIFDEGSADIAVEGGVNGKATIRAINDANKQTQITTLRSSPPLPSIWNNMPSKNLSVFYGNGDNVAVVNAGTGSTYFTTANRPQMTILNNGNVGVGTTTPTSKLHITGNANTNEVLDAITIMNIGGGGSGMEFTSDGNLDRGLKIGNQAHVEAGNYSYISAAGGESFSIRINAGINSSGNTGFLDLNRFGNSTALVRMGTTTVERSLYVNDNVGIGMTTPATKLQVAGVIAPSLDNTYTLGNSTYRFSEVYAANGVINTSDERLKDNIATLTYGLDAINDLKPVFFSWADNPDQGSKLGLVAQDVQLVIPEIVVTGDDPSHTLGIRYTELIPVLIHAVQELAGKVATLAEGTFDTIFARKIVVDLGEFERIVAREELRSDGRLCLEDLCITRDDLAAILESQTGQGSAASPTPVAPNSEPTPEEDATALDEEATEPDDTVSPDEADLEEEDEPAEPSSSDVESAEEQPVTVSEAEPTEG